MGKSSWKRDWLKQLAVATGYAIVYEAQHPFSAPQFFLGSAIRIICLLFVPYRYWPAIAIGEFIPNWLVVYPCLDQLGPAWVAVRAIPPIVVIMPIVWWCRSRLALFPNEHLTDIKALLACTIASSLVFRPGNNFA
jgi:two-component system, NarL family, sensor histidine kinase FusK